MSTKPSSTTGAFSPLTGPVRTDEEFDLDNLTDEEREVLEADQFIIYGRANIEQWNDPGPGEDHLLIELDALEEKLDQLLALNNLSRVHKDVKVGEFLEEYTLEDSTTIHLDAGETLRFDAGETLRTQVVHEGDPLPGSDQPAEEDALWIVANVYGKNDVEGSVMSEQTRLASYYGHLDGFSVTVYTREFEPDSSPDDYGKRPNGQGKRPTEVDFLAVTIGEDDLIKNKGSTYGVAEFQALFGTDDAGTTPWHTSRQTAEVPRDGIMQRVTMGFFNNLFSQAREGLVNETISTARENDLSLHAAAAEVAGDDEADHIAEQAEERLESITDRLEQEAMDRDDLAAEVADELGMDVEEVHALFDELQNAVEEQEDEEPEDEVGEDEEPGTDEQGLSDEQQSEVSDIVEQAVGNAIPDGLESLVEAQAEAESGSGEPSGDTDEEFVTEDQLDERFETLEAQLESNFEDLGSTIADNLEAQMEATQTPNPTGGNVNAENDLKQSVEGVVDAMSLTGEGGD